MEKVRKHRAIKLVTTNKTKKYLVSEPMYDHKMFFRKFINNRNENGKASISRSVNIRN